MKLGRSIVGWPGGAAVPPEETPLAIYGGGLLSVYSSEPRRHWRAYPGWAPLNEWSVFEEAYAPPVDREAQARELEARLKAAFGVAEKVSGLEQRLERIESVLSDVLKRLDGLAFRKLFLWVPIESFAPEPYDLLRPLTAVIMPSGDGFEAGVFDANLYASGDTEEEALSNLKTLIVDTYEALDRLGDSQLGPGPAQQRQVLIGVIRKAEEL